MELDVGPVVLVFEVFEDAGGDVPVWESHLCLLGDVGLPYVKIFGEMESGPDFFFSIAGFNVGFKEP